MPFSIIKHETKHGNQNFSAPSQSVIVRPWLCTNVGKLFIKVHSNILPSAVLEDKYNTLIFSNKCGSFCGLEAVKIIKHSFLHHSFCKDLYMEIISLLTLHFCRSLLCFLSFSRQISWYKVVKSWLRLVKLIVRLSMCL